MTWNPLANPIDWYLLVGKKSPGISEVVGANSPRKWDEQQSFGWSGATLRFAGLGLSKFEIKTRLYTRAEWDDWNQNFEPLLARPLVGKKPKAMMIWHPFLTSKQIFAVVVVDIVGPVQIEPGVWEHTVQYVQYRERRFQLAKPDAVKDTPKDPIDQVIDRKRETVEQLMAELAKP